MPKGHGKSSATSATRKKHQKKTAASLGIDLDPSSLTKPPSHKPKNKEKSGRGKKDRKEPKVKVYIPPVKPARVLPDPLEAGGLARRLPPELVVVLRNVGKKAQVTKVKALEDLGSAWVEKALGENSLIENGIDVVSSLVEMTPAWTSYLPSLFIHPSRRVRLLAASVHANLLKVTEVRERLLFYLTETATSEEVESVLGSWCVLVHDVEKSVGNAAKEAWNSFIQNPSSSARPGQQEHSVETPSVKHLVLDATFKNAIFGFVQRTAMDPLEFDESEIDRSARLRISGLGGLGWFLDDDVISEEAMTLLKNPLLWTVLYHAEKTFYLESEYGRGNAPEGFGFGQPNVRKAGWVLLMKLLDVHKEHISPIVPVLSSSVLRSAWVEPDILVQGTMLQPLLTFIKEFPGCWDIELETCYRNSNQEGEDENDEDDSEEEGDEKEAADPSQDKCVSVAQPSLAYQEFLQFLQLGCSGSPIQGYPTVVIILSTIPSSVIASSGSKTPLEDLFTSLWAALDGPLLECVVFMARRMILDGQKPKEEMTRRSSGLVPDNDLDVVEEARKLVKEHFGRVWQEMRAGRLRVDERHGARLVAQNLDALEKVDSQLAVGLRDAVWGVVAGELKGATRSSPGLVAASLKVLYDHITEGSVGRSEIVDLVHATLDGSVQRIAESVQTETKEGIKEQIAFLECMLEQFKEGLFGSVSFVERFDDLVQSHTGLLFETSSSFLTNDVLKIWHALLGAITATAYDTEKMRTIAMEVIQAVRRGTLPNYLKPESNELDVMVGSLLGEVLGGDSSANVNLELVRGILGVHSYFISDEGYAEFFETIATAVNIRVELLLGNPKQEDLKLDGFSGPIEILDLVTSQTNAHEEGALDGVLPNVFLFGHLVPECAVYGFDMKSRVFTVAQGIWAREVAPEKLDKERKDKIIVDVKAKLADLLVDTQVRPLPEEILSALTTQGPKLNISILDDIFPSSETLDGMLRQLPHVPIDPSLAVIDPLIPEDIDSPLRAPEYTDRRGFASYTRIVNALLRVFLEDRKLAEQNLWALKHFIVLSICASDYQKVPAATSPIFNAKALGDLGEVITRIQHVTIYLFLGSLSDAQDDWRRAIIKRVGEGKSGQSGTQLENFVENVVRVAIESDSVLDTRVLKVVLEEILDDLEQEEAEEWLRLAKKLERSAPQTSMTIISAITGTRAEPNGLDRFRNEQAAELLGIKPSKINSTGLLTLRRLAASAPDLESDVVFLPQNRAVNVVKACQNWVTSDDADIEEEVESAMTLIFVYLAPILQNVPGSHWEFIWDVLENNLENASITDDRTLPSLIRSLRLVIIMEDLVKTNKYLRAEWDQRRTHVLEMIRNMALIKLDTISPSLPRSSCRELILSILYNLPESLMDESTMSKMCHLVTDHSLEVQKMGYGILRAAAKKRTEHLVVEAGVDTESTFKATLPSELLDIVQRHVNTQNLADGDEQLNVLGSLLGWMLVFDLFQDGSFKVKSGYIEQLRNLELVSTNFIPLFLALLHLEAGLEKVFKLNVWVVSDFYVELIELGNPISIHLLAAHVYYRALLCVPALIYSWLSNCKDRQLSTTITSYTSQYFSPVIIDVELAHVKGVASQELADDSMSIKVAAAVNEVSASYLVDEHQLEIRLKIPTDWPLHKIEVKDLKRVGVDKDRWRAWILAVQQTIWSHNGRITDGLSLFKKNATLHFEGQVECAICYSIISVMDGSLPKKPCKTCKNKFHAGCLYKWFHTSNASTCPLCRSEIILG
ncbi:E3 ubiquitin-protein ligase listerin [Leucoagaricus sp. SymC.cos]|nr:E3 ubiquitin-protein ligase listerin [Leucoagaricus sp. SymC.cos]